MEDNIIKFPTVPTAKDRLPGGSLKKERVLSSSGAGPEVRVQKSLKIIGEFTLIHEDGKVEHIKGKRAFCRCGLSSAMPFCDNTHRSKLEWVKKVKEDEPPEEVPF